MIDIAKYFDTIPHKLIRKCSKKFITNVIIRKFIEQYYVGSGCGVYQGDSLSPILFAYISHFLIQQIERIVDHIQMFADDMIVIIRGTKKTDFQKI